MFCSCVLVHRKPQPTVFLWVWFYFFFYIKRITFYIKFTPPCAQSSLRLDRKYSNQSHGMMTGHFIFILWLMMPPADYMRSDFSLSAAHSNTKYTQRGVFNRGYSPTLACFISFINENTQLWHQWVSWKVTITIFLFHDRHVYFYNYINVLCHSNTLFLPSDTSDSQYIKMHLLEL